MAGEVGWGGTKLRFEKQLWNWGASRRDEAIFEFGSAIAEAAFEGLSSEN